jgi:hypothetical protein
VSLSLSKQNSLAFMYLSLREVGLCDERKYVINKLGN